MTKAVSSPPVVVTTVTDAGNPVFEATKSQLLDWLNEHGETFGIAFEPQHFVLEARRDGNLVGGLLASTNLGWMHVILLAVAPEARRQGIGRCLLEAAEALARERGCHGAWIDTYDHQGPDYYPRLGWEKFGELPDFPKGGCRRFYRKAL